MAAPSDEEADSLASSLYQRVHGIVTGRRGKLPLPVEGYLRSLHPQELAAVQYFLAAAVIGGPDTVRQGLQQIADLTQADEFIMVSDVYDVDLRLRSLSLTREIMSQQSVPAL